MTALLILTALELEARALARELELPPLSSFSFPAFGRPRLRLAPVGLRAALCGARWRELSDGLDHPLVVSAGVCGALERALAPASLVIPERVMGPSGDLYAVAAGAHRTVLARAGRPAETGLVLTVREAVETPAAKAALRAETGAVAVDMESAVIAACAQAAGWPALVVRAVADGAHEDLPKDLVDLVTPVGRLAHRRALALAITRPGVLPHVLTLWGRTRRALAAVARALRAIIE